MNYSEQDILDFIEDNDVKFVRLAFCDIFGSLKNLSVNASEMPRVFREGGVCFDGSSIHSFMNVEESDLELWPDPGTVTILPWRPTDGRVIRMFCDVTLPGGKPFSGNCRGYLRSVVDRFARRGITCNVGTECEFYLFQTDDDGQPTRIPHDRGGYFDVAPLDKGENIRREICLSLEDMGIHPTHSHHESGHGQNEVDFQYSPALQAADNLIAFKSVVKAIANRNGLYASFMPKPFKNDSGSGLHINISLVRDGQNLFEGDILPDSIAGHFMAGIMAHARELSAFCNPLPNSYARFGSFEAPQYVSWSRQNRSQMVRIPSARGENCRMELRSPDPSCNPYLALGLILAAGLEGIEQELPLPKAVNENLYLEGAASGLERLPVTLQEAIELAEGSAFVRRELSDALAEKYFAEQRRQWAGFSSAENKEDYERLHYFNII